MALRVKLTSGSPGDIDLSAFLDHSESTTQGIEFFLNRPDLDWTDVWVVLDIVDVDFDTSCHARPGCLIFAAAETSWPPGFFTSFPERTHYLSQFDVIYSPLDLPLPNVIREPPFLPWMINGNHGTALSPHPRDVGFLRSLRPMVKSRQVSMIVSSKKITEEQRARLKFAERISKLLGNDLDWFGSGIRPIEEKWDAIVPYEFHIALENRISTSLYSEKLIDAYLGWSLPIYWGAPNIASYFPRGSMVTVDASNPRSAADCVLRALDAGVSEEQLEAIGTARGIALGSQSFLSRLARIARDAYALRRDESPVLRRLRPSTIKNVVGYRELNQNSASGLGYMRRKWIHGPKGAMKRGD